MATIKQLPGKLWRPVRHAGARSLRLLAAAVAISLVLIVLDAVLLGDEQPGTRD